MSRSINWVEKFRPRKIDDIISQQHIKDIIKGYIKNKNIPHLLFFGPSGCGKTSTILALARELFTDEYFDNRVIEMNASDERGIKVIREKIKRYAQLSINKKKNIPDFKIIILDEADSMTSESQFALRKIMEDYSHITRFCIICNYHNKIIEPIISRCSLLRFKPIDKESILNKLKEICKLENINLSNDKLNTIIDLCNGDLRKSINYLQKCNKNNDIYETSGLINKDSLEEFLYLCLNKNDIKVNNMINKFYKDGYSITNQIIMLIRLTQNINIDSNIKSKIILKLLEVDYNLNSGCNEYIQFMNIAYYIVSL